MKKLFYLLLINLTFLIGQNNVATTSAAFLEIGAGARSLGMGGAFVSVANDASSMYWNPAGIVNVNTVNLENYYAPWLVETDYYYSTAIVPMGNIGNIGVSYTAITMDEMLVRTVDDPEPDIYGQKFDAGNLALGLAYAKKITDQFSFGIKSKYIQEKIWQMQATGYAVDIGTLFITKSKIRVGMSISNFGGKLGMEGINTLVDIDIDETIYGNNDRIDGYLDASKWPLPLIFRFGLSKEFLANDYFKFLLSADAIHPNNNPEYLNVGAEISAMDLLFLRLGKSHFLYRQKFVEDGSSVIIEHEQGFSLGAGLKYQIPRGPMLIVDYVLTNYGVFKNISGYSVKLSF